MIFRSLLTLLFAFSLALSGDGVCVATSAFYKNENALSHTLKLHVKGSVTEAASFIGTLTDVGAMLTGSGAVRGLTGRAVGASRGLAGRAVGTTRGLSVRAGGALRDLAAKALMGARARLAKLKSRPKPRRNLSDGGEFDGPALRMGEQPFGAPSPGPKLLPSGMPSFGSSLKDVAKYIFKNKKLPDNFITKAGAKKIGWNPRKGNLHEVAPGKSIGGDVFGNKEGLLPSAPGRKWFEADLNYAKGYRGSERILYSNDGKIFYTGDHYKTFQQLGN